MRDIEWINFKAIREGVEPPRYAKTGDAGFNLVALEDYHIACGETRKIPLGFALEIPPGYEVQIRPRSGKAILWGNYVVNSPGTIDSSFRGEICLLIGSERCALKIKKGDRIAQGVLNRVPTALFHVVKKLNQTDRGEGGFGHTGR